MELAREDALGEPRAWAAQKPGIESKGNSMPYQPAASQRRVKQHHGHDRGAWRPRLLSAGCA